MGFPFALPIKPMLAKLARTIPTTPGLIFEPKWDGFRCIVARDGDHIHLISRNQKPLNRYFPELVDALVETLPEHCVVDGEIVVPDSHDHGLDFDALQQRIHPAASRVERLAAETPSHFVAFDLLAFGDENLLDTPFALRRARLIELLGHADAQRVHITPATTSTTTAAEWFTQFEGAGLDGIIAKPADGTYEPNKRALIKVKHQRTADCAVAGYRVHKDGNGVGSLLLGLFDGDQLRSVGVCSAFTAARRAELLAELHPLTVDALANHPWQAWAEHDMGARPGGGSRWDQGKDLSFVPLRVERVLEVTFGQLESGRFRHGVSFVRWRDDRDPSSCTFDQLDVAHPVPFADLINEDFSV